MGFSSFIKIRSIFWSIPRVWEQLDRKQYLEHACDPTLISSKIQCLYFFFKLQVIELILEFELPKLPSLLINFNYKIPHTGCSFILQYSFKLLHPWMCLFYPIQNFWKLYGPRSLVPLCMDWTLWVRTQEPKTNFMKQ